MRKRILLFVLGLMTVAGAFVGGLAAGVLVLERSDIIEVERIVTVPVEIEKVVTVPVEVLVEVEKIVTRTVTVIVEVTPTPASTPTPTPSTPTPTPAPVEGDPTECLENDAAYLQDLASRYSTFEVHEDLASTTPRLALATVLGQMAEQRIDLVSMKPLEGCSGARGVLQSWMTLSIEAFQAFLARRPDSVVSAAIREAAAEKNRAAVNINLALAHIGKAPLLSEPESSGSESQPTTPTAPAVPNVEFVEDSLGFRIQERNNSWWKFAYQFTLKNNTDQVIAVSVDVKFLDADGFVVDDAIAYDIKVPARGTKAYSDSTLIDASEAASVVSIQIEER